LARKAAVNRRAYRLHRLRRNANRHDALSITVGGAARFIAYVNRAYINWRAGPHDDRPRRAGRDEGAPVTICPEPTLRIELTDLAWALMLRIAMISTVYKQTPPVGYGGIERVVHTLTQELVSRGHEVTLFATPGSHCDGTTIEIAGYDSATSPSGIHSRSAFLSEEPLFAAMAEHLTPDRFDVVHDFSFGNLFVTRYPERLPYIISACIPIDPPSPRPNVVACSAAHAGLLGNGARFVRYGLDLSRWPVRYDKECHLVHIAKIAPYKGQHEGAIAAALARRELRIVGNVEHSLYHRSIVLPLTWALPGVSYQGETMSTRDLLLPASALVQTPKWFDAFPLIILEALACGTPVIAYGEGGIAEQIDHGVNGFICHGIRELAQMIGRAQEIDPRACREHAEAHFSVARMADEYGELYARVMDGESW